MVNVGKYASPMDHGWNGFLSLGFQPCVFQISVSNDSDSFNLDAHLPYPYNPCCERIFTDPWKPYKSTIHGSVNIRSSHGYIYIYTWIRLVLRLWLHVFYVTMLAMLFCDNKNTTRIASRVWMDWIPWNMKIIIRTNPRKLTWLAGITTMNEDVYPVKPMLVYWRVYED